MDLRNFADVKTRRAALEENLKLQLSNIGHFSLDENAASKKNCENMIGATQIPLGIAGPLTINSQLPTPNSYYLPLATTEGALVASINRGCSSINQSGGATVISEKIGITRAPIFKVENISQAQNLIKFINSNFSKIKQITEGTSHHLTLLKIEPISLGRNVWLRFFFDSGNAMGMNMATIAVAKAIPFIEKNTTSICVALSGNLCVDKKPNYLNFIGGRGYKVQAETVLSENIVSSVLKTDINKIIEVVRDKLFYGSVLSGAVGANAHFANILSAIFIATGQDPAHVSESAAGITTAEKTKEGLYFSIYLPDLIIGTVGGGTNLATQKEALSIMGIKNVQNSSQKFAEIIGGAVLAGELSLIASLAEGSLAKAHEKYGR